ncbi:MAG: RNA-binding protein [Candidatus Altiarchaeales archaeon]|nr:MAG: RNA-binding protein [Candidatus Altiarchaeales archaeon]
MLNVKDRDLVIPGQLLGENLYHDLNCFRENNHVYSSVEGMVRIEGKRVKVIPSTGIYIPKEDDVIIGVITNVLVDIFFVDINSPYNCSMRGEEVSKDAMKKDLSRYLKVGDIITAKISEVNEVYSCQLIRPWKIEGGLIIDVNPKRVPRVIGKRRSMLNMIKEKTKSKIIVGQNGKIWIKGGNVDLAVRIIKRIERYAQTRGLTDKIAEILKKES